MYACVRALASSLIFHPRRINKMSAVDLSRLRPSESSLQTDQNGNGSTSNDMEDIYDEGVSELEVGKKDWSQMNWKLSQVRGPSRPKSPIFC